MMLVCLKDGKRIQIDPATILSKTPIKMDQDVEHTSSSSSSNYSSINTDDDDTMDSLQTIQTSSLKQNEETPKKKRQRLTHLTPEEKLMRRKLKNRVAAQSARDRKKVKMEDLEKTVALLQEQNENLKKENSLLKEKAHILLDQNRKLLKYKQDNEASQQSVACKKRKLEEEKICFEVAGSAVSVSRVSLPQKLLQKQIIQNLICAFLMVIGLGLKTNTTTNKNHHKNAQNNNFEINQIVKADSKSQDSIKSIEIERNEFNKNQFTPIGTIDYQINEQNEKNGKLTFILNEKEKNTDMIDFEDIEKLDEFIDEMTLNLVQQSSDSILDEKKAIEKLNIENELESFDFDIFENLLCDLEPVNFNPSDFISSNLMNSSDFLMR
ncbi:unnamed protein product [Brachionus calyciflorus]|uniref:X-box-binding protein 1 n=1 Tax=Brachionus calyciflorus TaxID=104777 RepID=A0A813M7K1_9BILA|nr:unnamed protein product [Brachionus calyciflorus]